MRFFPSDWQGFLSDAALWGQLSIPARRTFLDGMRPGLSLEIDTDDDAISELREAGFLSDAANPDYQTVSPPFTRFHRLAKILEKIAVFETPGFDVLREYLVEHFTQAERSLLHESLAFHPDDFSRIARLITSLEWLEEFLSRDRLQRQEKESWPATKEMLRFFMEQRNRVPLRDLEEYFPAMGRAALASALKLGVQSLVFFLALRRSDLEPIVGIWPSTARRLRRATIALPPESVLPERRFRHPYLLEDMTTILLDAGVEAIPMRRNDEKPFSRYEEERAESLLSLPAWLEEFTGATPRIRVGAALSALRLGGLLEASPEGDTLRLRPADGAIEWALSDAKRRLTGFLGRVPATGRPAALLSLLLGPWSTWTESAADILPPLVQAFQSSPRSSFIRFQDFARYQTAIANPLIPLRERGGGTALWTGLSSVPSDELLEDLWQSFLHAYLSFGLIAFGGAEAGTSPEGRPCFRLTRAGRSLLEIEDRPGEEDPAAPSAREDIVVQPTFEVAFLSASPEAEAEIARFSERTGREVGALFRITKGKVLRAAAAGLTAERMIGSLARFSKNPIPPNVDHEIRGWLEVKP